MLLYMTMMMMMMFYGYKRANDKAGVDRQRWMQTMLITLLLHFRGRSASCKVSCRRWVCLSLTMLLVGSIDTVGHVTGMAFGRLKHHAAKSSWIPGGGKPRGNWLIDVHVEISCGNGVDDDDE